MSFEKLLPSGFLMECVLLNNPSSPVKPSKRNANVVDSNLTVSSVLLSSTLPSSVCLLAQRSAEIGNQNFNNVDLMLALVLSCRVQCRARLPKN